MSLPKINNHIFIVFLNFILSHNIYSQDHHKINVDKIVSLDKKAISNAKLLNKLIVEAHNELIKYGNISPTENHIEMAITHGIYPLLKPLHSKIQIKTNPLYNYDTDCIYSSAFDLCIRPLAKISILNIITNKSDLGQVKGYYRPRDPSTGSPAVACASVLVSQPFLDSSVGMTKIFSIFTNIDESDNDNIAKKYVTKIHQQIRTRYHRARTSSLPLTSAGEFQINVFGKGPTHTEVPDYWVLQHPLRQKIPICNSIVIDETSEDSINTQQSIDKFYPWKIYIGYFPGSSTSLPVLTTAVYLVHPIKTTKDEYNHIYIIKSQLY